MMTQDDDAKLDAMFAQARSQDVTPSEGLLDRVMMDADSVLAASEVPPAEAVAGPSWGAMFLEAIGGWPSLSGLAAATVAGLWIGISPPAALSDVSAGLFGTTIELPLLESDVLAGLEG